MGTTCFIGVEIEKDVPPVGELAPETTVERWVADSGCSQFMTRSADYIVNYREGGGVVRITDGRARPIEGIGNLPMSFWSGKDWVQVILPNVAHVPLLGYNLLSLKRMADRGHKYIGEKKGVRLHLENRKTLFVIFPDSDALLTRVVLRLQRLRRERSRPFRLWISIRFTRPTGMYMRNRSVP